MGKTNIQWTANQRADGTWEPGYTFNPWIGCRRVAPECLHCYAETLDRNRFSKTMGGATKEKPVSHWGSGPRYRTSASNWKEPLKWNRLAENSECGDCDPCLAGQRCAIGGVYPRVFCASLSDWLDDENVPIEWLRDLLHLIRATPKLDWLLLSKRPQNWQQRIDECVAYTPGNEDEEQTAIFARDWINGDAPRNVWIGVSAGANQQAALDIPARIHFLSCEPMLHPLETADGRCPKCGYHKTDAAIHLDHDRCSGKIPTGFDWAIFGGESGPKARPCRVDWIREGVQFCREHHIAPFVKQLGSSPVWNRDESTKYLRDSHGGDIDEWPEDLRVREFPTP